MDATAGAYGVPPRREKDPAFYSPENLLLRRGWQETKNSGAFS
jgi:hypothetical protein